LSASSVEAKMEIISRNAENVHQNAARTSCRKKKTLITRNEDISRATHTSKTV
jgi:hypothetical protein